MKKIDKETKEGIKYGIIFAFIIIFSVLCIVIIFKISNDDCKLWAQENHCDAICSQHCNSKSNLKYEEIIFLENDDRYVCPCECGNYIVTKTCL